MSTKFADRQTDAFKGSPCVGRCSTVYGDSVCRGCKRFIHEITQWNQYSNKQKELVWRRLEHIISTVVPRWVNIEYPDRLGEFLQHHAIRYDSHLPPTAWALVCIEAFPYHLRELPKAGIRLKNEQLLRKDKQTVLEALQRELYEVSLAYHQRQSQYLQSQHLKEATGQ